MRLTEIYVEMFQKEEHPAYLGGFLMDCGIGIYGIHFIIRGDILHVNYPAIRDKKAIFHPSFCILDNSEDQKIKQMLKDTWEQAVERGKSVYGYPESGEEIVWTDERQEERQKLQALMELQQLSITVKLSPIQQGADGRKTAYGRITIDGQVVISNIKVMQSGTEEIEIRFPKHGRDETIWFRSDADREWLEQYIAEKFCQQEKLCGKEGEERLFQILWDASDNGYILQSKIRGILEKNQIDWQEKYQVQRIGQLIEKMDFLSARRLETRPEHFVDWVAISYEKDPESQTSATEKGADLPDDLKAELYEALHKKYEAEGKINLAEIIPYMQEQVPKLLERLPRIKLKVILKSCNFVTFEGGPMPPIYIHIKSLVSVQGGNNIGFSEKQSSDPKVLTDNLNQCVNLDIMDKTSLDGQSQLNEAEDKKDPFCDRKNKKNEKSEQHSRLALTNPFTYVKNTKLLLETQIPDTKLQSVNSDEAMRRLLTMTSHGQLDSMDLELVYWISNLQYAKSTFLYDLIIGGFIPLPPEKKISKDKLSKRLTRLYKLKLIEFYKLCSVNEDGIITNKASHRILMLTVFGRTQLKMIGRQSTFDYFMPLDNIEKILNKLSVNQWFTKFIMLFKDAFYYFDTVLTAKIAEANAARISLVISKEGIPVFVTAFKRGNVHNESIRSGEFDFWIKRVSSLLENYRELYIDARRVEYRKVPKMVFICEDLEHCYEIYRQMQDTTERIGNTVILDNLWFAEDLNIYNDFLHAHFRINDDLETFSVSLEELLEIRVEKPSDFETEYEQRDEEDTRLLEEFNYEGGSA